MTTKKIEVVNNNGGSYHCKYESFVREWAAGYACIYGVPTKSHICAQCDLRLSVIQSSDHL